MTERNMAQAINNCLDSALASDPDVVILGEDVGRTGGVFRVTDGLQEAFGENRVIDTPVAESGIVGAAFGMAVGGLRPVAEIQFMGFSYPAFDQVVSHVSRIRNRSQHRFTAPLVIRIPYGGGIGAAEHHSESTEALYTHVPGIKVVTPSTAYDAKGLLAASIADPDPVVFLEPIRGYRASKEEVPDDDYTIPLGEAEVLREGTDITLISWGAMMRETNAAADELETAGTSVEVIDLRSLVPLDAATVVTSVHNTGRAVVVQEAPRTGGFASEVASVIQERALFSLAAPIERVTGWDVIVPLRKAEQHYIPSTERVLAAARRALEA